MHLHHDGVDDDGDDDDDDDDDEDANEDDNSREPVGALRDCAGPLFSPQQ